MNMNAPRIDFVCDSRNPKSTLHLALIFIIHRIPVFFSKGGLIQVTVS